MEKQSKKMFSMSKLNKSSIIELNDKDMSVVAGGEVDILSIGARCSCDNSCDRDNVPKSCCCPPNHPSVAS